MTHKTKPKPAEEANHAYELFEENQIGPVLTDVDIYTSTGNSFLVNCSEGKLTIRLSKSAEARTLSSRVMPLILNILPKCCLPLSLNS